MPGKPQYPVLYSTLVTWYRWESKCQSRNAISMFSSQIWIHLSRHLRVGLLNWPRNPGTALICGGCETEHTRVFLRTRAKSVESFLACHPRISARKGGDPTFLNILLVWKLYYGNFMEALIQNLCTGRKNLHEWALNKTFADHKFSTSVSIWKGLSDSGIRS